MAKTFTPQISKRTQDAIVLCKMAEELKDRFAEFSFSHGNFCTTIIDAENDITAVCGDIADVLEYCIGDDRRLDNE